MLLIPIVPLLLACPAFYFSGKARRYSISVSEKEILDSSETLDVTLRDLTILKEIRTRKIVVYGKDIDGHFWEYPPGILKTENWRLFLLGGIEAQSVFFLEGWFPSKGLYLLKPDLLELRQAVDIDTKTETETKLHTKPVTAFEPQVEKVEPVKASEISIQPKKSKNKKDYSRPRILDELAENTRFCPFLKCVLWKKDNAGKFLRKAKKAKTTKKLTPARTRYFNTIEYCFENWSTSKSYSKGTLKGDAKNTFEQELLTHLKGLIEFKHTDAELLIKFFSADMRSLNT